MMMTWRRTLLGKGRWRLAGGSARRGVIVVAAATLATVAGTGLLAAGGAARAVGGPGVAGTAGISWGRAEALHGSPAFSRSGGVSVSSLSCWSVNNCAAGGSFFVSGLTFSDFVVVERNGRWGRAKPPPGMAALGNDAFVTTVSCAAGGYCVAGGFYADRNGHWQAFVATYKKGRWQPPLGVRGTKVRHHQAFISSVSCLSARRCVAAGDNDLGAFVTWQVKGVWRAAKVFTGIGGGRTELSCWSPLDCVVARALTVSELNGVWGTPQAIPGTDRDQVTAVSCARDGYCAVAGCNDANGGSCGPPFVASGPDGSFGTAVTWPGFAPGPLSCPSAGNCVVAGGSQVVSQTGGVWGTPETLPGTGTDVTINSLSCWSAGNCGAGGSYVTAGGQTEPFVASEISGRWTAPEPVPGITALNKHNSGNNGIVAVSCPSARHCTAAGTYTSAHGRQLGFVTGPA